MSWSLVTLPTEDWMTSEFINICLPDDELERKGSITWEKFPCIYISSGPAIFSRHYLLNQSFSSEPQNLEVLWVTLFPFSSGEKAHTCHPPSSLEKTDFVSAVLVTTAKHVLTDSLVLHFYTEA